MKNAVFLDVDGTLTRDISSWEKAHNYFGEHDKTILAGMEKNTARYFAGEIDYNQWATLDVELWKGRPINDLYHALLPPLMIDQAKEGIQILKDLGYDIILISGGIDILVNDVAERVNADEAYSNTIHHTDGKIDGNVTIGVGEKAPVVQSLAKTNGYNLNKSIAVGDNVNDIDMFQTVGFSVALNPSKKEVKEAATYVTYHNNFAEFVEEMLEIYQNGKLS